MKAVRLLFLLAVLVAGLVIGSLNSQPVDVSLAFWVLRTTSGVAIIVSLLAGALLGGALVVAGVVIPLYAKLRRANKAAAAGLEPPAPPSPSPFDGR
ncbi:lipopolysaccharide assembly protein LapA domain-containing protein [Stenotrophomonas mori]|uniref:Lipopolysaccharide assembly protein LapA domain-containing protein n=1 Tax=Stenotrophomonas mori TaxID=2871096 RepID=A0ABT0SFF2_9GAMM|nr:lipopolysaccharide assembly protein LapA domain-containing protein [Stenotrophomonas mori]MCL7714032.1 lipopolysaccharide assembly protein LapA domain-containing protein [Stenotrophomonas mori]